MNSENKIKVLIVDDIISTAINGKFALQKLSTLKPDIITLDIEMPEMNGLDFLREKNRLNDNTPVIVISSLTSEGSKVTIEALELGAKDYIHKPSGSISLDIKDIKDEIILKIKNWAIKSKGLYLKKSENYTLENYKKFQEKNDSSKAYGGFKKLGIKEETKEKIKEEPNIIPKNPDFVAIGISTGGPEALRTILPLIKKDFPIVIVQHMPPMFTFEFAKSLNKIVKNYNIVEAKDGDTIQKKYIYIAPGAKQLGLKKVDNKYIIFVNDDPPINNHKPSVDYLFKSLYEIDSTNFIAIIMTGMGKDGAYYITKLRMKGVFTIGQDESTSIVYGMPKVAYEMGGIDIVLQLLDIPDFINKI